MKGVLVDRSDFVHLHTHTEYSMLDGAASNEKLFAEVARQGMPAVAMTDHGNMFGAYEFFQISKKYDGDQNPLIKPIIGSEARRSEHPQVTSTGILGDLS